MADYPSLRTIRAELDRRLGEQERRGAAFDTRAGLLLAFAGVLIGLPGAHPHPAQLASQIIALGGAIGAGLVLRPRVSSGIAPREMRDRYLMRDPEHTELKLFDTRVFLYERDEKRIEAKSRWLVRSAIVLLIAAAIEVTGATIGAFS